MDDDGRTSPRIESPNFGADMNVIAHLMASLAAVAVRGSS